ncbi:pyridoxamine 5'-phosphate oxidase family protein [Mycobacterium sp. 1423905.2]|uniref:pyridoxamine 5'-phosphate oxidase family protein n=1 Tax=Mycobacterium sp. 1423905.2 TaxID=1856859 RepID=UPI0012EA32F6
MTEDEKDFLAERESCYLATASETGWPYVQFRGGPAGFHRLSTTTPLVGRRGTDYDEQGRVTADRLSELRLPVDAEAFLCGPATFMDAVSGALAREGIAPARGHTERFGAGMRLTPGIATVRRTPHAPTGPVGPGPAVQFVRSSSAFHGRPRTPSSIFERVLTTWGQCVPLIEFAAKSAAWSVIPLVR